MKAYYLQKARDPSDLPDWLFSAQECHPGRTHPIEDVPGDDDGARKAAQPVHGREPRNMYDTAASEPRTRDMREGRGDPSEPSSSKAADRLKAMRDARRQGTGASGGRDGGYEAGHVRSRAELSGVARDDGRVARGPGGRIGLPVGPGRVRRV